MLTDYTKNTIAPRMVHLSPEDQTFVVMMLEDVQRELATVSGSSDKTQNQVGWLAGLMDLERPDRLEVLAILVGFPLHYEGQAFPGYKPLEEMEEEKRALYPGASSKDMRITGEMANILIDYYSRYQQEMYRVHSLLGFQSLTDIRAERRAARAIAKAAKAAERAAAKLARRAKTGNSAGNGELTISL